LRPIAAASEGRVYPESDEAQTLMADQAADTEVRAGWYPDRDDPKTLRYWDGQKHTEQRVPAPSRETGRTAAILSGLALGFGGVGGGIALFDCPVLLFPVPLGFGIAGAALCVAALTVKGPKPWYLALAVIAAIGGIVVGVRGYNDFSEASKSIENIQETFGP
jgi:hypothetical protein